MGVYLWYENIIQNIDWRTDCHSAWIPCAVRCIADQFEEWGAGLERVGEWEQDYKAKNPNATDVEVDAAFKSDIAKITVWMEQYKAEHPGATDADAEAAFRAAWGN